LREIRPMASRVDSSTGAATLDPPSVRTSGDHNGSITDWLLCRDGSHQFALPVPHVIETMRMLPIKSLAGAPPMVRGICIIRGAPTPVVDCALMFNERPAPSERLVTVRTGKRTVAFATQAVLGVQAIRVEALERLPPLLSNVQTIAAMRALDGELVFLLQIARVIPDDVLDRCAVEGMHV
jgi:purine-binding chemotaxis protein CheW